MTDSALRSGLRAARAEVPILEMTLVLAVFRTVVGLVFVVIGTILVTHHERFASDFLAWHVPAAALAAWLVGVAAIVCGILFALGALTRPVGLLLATMSVAAAMTAGRSAGGGYAVVPSILFLCCVFFAWRSGRRGSPAPLRPPGVQ